MASSKSTWRRYQWRRLDFLQLAKFGLLFALLPFLTVTSSAASTPAHYVVFEVDPEGIAVPVFHRRVVLSEAPLGADADRLRKAQTAARNGQQLVWVEARQPSGAASYLDVVRTSAELRGEFHGSSHLDGGFEIEHHRIRAQDPAFVLRIPVSEAGTVLVLSGAAAARIDLDALERQADQLKLAHLALPPAAAKSLEKTSSANRADFLVMGDGYTATQQDLFRSHASRMVDEFFSITPYREYLSYAKITRLFTASAESGADHPPFVAGCSSNDTSCCGDSASQGDPKAGTFVQTAFNARFCTANIQRLLTVSVSQTLSAASAFPDWDQILMIVNDDTFGGSGGLIAVGSVSSFATEVMQHEVGHSFTGLADEYESSITGAVRCREANQGCEPNVTDATQREQIKWLPWIRPSTPIPTPESQGFATDVGLFQGARYFSSGQYRPRLNCAMRSLSVEFCEVCNQEYVLRLFQGGFGSPANGIDPIEPGSARPTPGSVNAGREPLTLSADLLQPSAGPRLDVQWWMDGQPASGATGSSFVFAPEEAGTYQVELRVDAETSLVHPAMVGDALKSSRTWTVRSDGVRGPLTAAFEWQGDQANVRVQFESTATGEPDSWRWNFGDGTESSAEHPAHTFAEPGLYTVRLTVSREGETTSVSQVVDVYGSATGPCEASATQLCLQTEERFKVEVLWRDFEGATGPAGVVPFESGDSGLLRFFDANNWEVLVKVLNACGFNDRIWVFAAATTTVEYALRVVDTVNGSSKTYINGLNNSSPAITDTDAFATCEDGAPVSSERVELGATNPQQPSSRDQTPPSVPCTDDATRFCLNDGRFEVSVTWQDFAGNTGSAQQSPASSDDSGVMWFFTENNWELLVKVLDGCGINQRYWIFAAATTDVEYTLRVRDSETGEVVEYFNPIGMASPSITDTDALAVCP